MFQVPYMVGKVRYDQEDDKEICNTVDVVFHPSSIMMAMTNPGLHKMVIFKLQDVVLAFYNQITVFLTVLVV